MLSAVFKQGSVEEWKHIASSQLAFSFSTKETKKVIFNRKFLELRPKTSKFVTSNKTREA